MGLSDEVGARAHDAMHRLPGMPDHATAGELNARQHRPLRNRPLSNRAVRNRPLRNRAVRNRPLRNRAGHHDRPARLFAGWQAWLGTRFRQGQR